MKGKRIRNLLMFAAVVVILCTAAVGIYTADYYRADEAATTVMKNETLVSIYDNTAVFYPEGETKTGLIFYPGGKVEYIAYAPLMQALAEEGILCLLPEMPLNLAVLDVHAADELREQFETVEKWYIGGHSLGGSMAASCASVHAGAYEGLILLAAYSTADLQETNLEILSLYGSCDGVLDMEKYEQYRPNLPMETIETVIEGGNHAQFGHYGSQDGDGEAVISVQEQMEQSVSAMKELILN